MCVCVCVCCVCLRTRALPALCTRKCHLLLPIYVSLSRARALSLSFSRSRSRSLSLSLVRSLCFVCTCDTFMHTWHRAHDCEYLNVYAYLNVYSCSYLTLRYCLYLTLFTVYTLLCLPFMPYFVWRVCACVCTCLRTCMHPCVCLWGVWTLFLIKLSLSLSLRWLT